MAKDNPAEFGRMLLACVEHEQTGHGRGHFRVPQRSQLEFLADWLEENGPHLLTDTNGDDKWFRVELGPAAREIATIPFRGRLQRNQRGKTRCCTLSLAPKADEATVTATLVFDASDMQGEPRPITARVTIGVNLTGNRQFNECVGGEWRKAEATLDVETTEEHAIEFAPTRLPLEFGDPGMQAGLDVLRWHAMRMLAGWTMGRLAMLHAEPVQMLSDGQKYAQMRSSNVIAPHGGVTYRSADVSREVLVAIREGLTIGREFFTRRELEDVYHEMVTNDPRERLGSVERILDNLLVCASAWRTLDRQRARQEAEQETHQPAA